MIQYFETSMILSLVLEDEFHEKASKMRKEISECRSLDTIHIGTAIFLKDKFNDPNLLFYSFDNRVNAVAKKMGIKQQSI